MFPGIQYITFLQAGQRSEVGQAQPSNGKLAERLYGVLGQGTWDEYDRTLIGNATREKKRLTNHSLRVMMSTVND